MEVNQATVGSTAGTVLNINPPVEAPAAAPVAQQDTSEVFQSAALPSASAEPSLSGMSILTIVMLVTFWPVGLILMWTSTQWSKKIKWIITVPFILIPVFAIFIFMSISTMATMAFFTLLPIQNIAKMRDNPASAPTTLEVQPVAPYPQFTPTVKPILEVQP